METSNQLQLSGLNQSFGNSLGSSNLLGQASNCIGDWWWQPQTYERIVHHYYPSYVNCWNSPNKTEQAFKIVKVLMDKKLAKVTTVKSFIELVNTLIEAL